jgi:hypothetical protein
VIKAEGVYHLLAHGIQSEPGERSRGFDFDSRCLANTVISHDNDAWAGTSLDSGFMQMGSGIHIGDFSNRSETWEANGIDYRLSLQVEGKAYFRDLKAGSLSCVVPSSTATKKELCQAVNDAEDETARLKAVVEEQGERIREQGVRLARLEQLLL